MSLKLFRNFKLTNADFNNSTPKSAMVVKNGIIAWIGDERKIPKVFLKIEKETNLKNQIVFPSFIECHTHSVFAGSRADEFEARNQGASYVEIAEKGGGILSTMKKTREISFNKLLKKSQQHVDIFLNQGVSTLEIKSGYALDLKNEIKMLEVIQKLKGPQIIPTFLGAHAKPPEFSTHTEYLKYLVKNVLPKVKSKALGQRVDIFIEKKFFEAQDSEFYLNEARKLGFDLVIHANQLSLSSGVELALKYEAKSADHVIHMTPSLIKKMAQSETVAVLLPVADLYMRCAYPPARELLDAGACVALATDFNPGSCPSQDLSLVGLLARLEMKMSLSEVFKAYTYGAAKALGVQDQEGRLEIGKKANFISTDADLSDFFYSAGHVPCHSLFILGKHTNLNKNQPK